MDSKSEPKTEMTYKELNETHPLYALYAAEWAFLYAAYEGTRELIRLGYLKQHERETEENYKRRCDQAYGFNYTQSVVDILNFYLHKKPVKRQYPSSMEKDVLFNAYLLNSNLSGDSLDEFFSEQSRLASIGGHIGLLVDKPNVTLSSKSEQLENLIYPYVSSYLPPNILDWEYSRDEVTGKLKLTMVKLLEEDGRYLIWYPEVVQAWELEDSESLPGESKQLLNDRAAKLVLDKEHKLGEIPFVFLTNKKGRIRPIGRSDVSDIARIDVSIIRNLSQGEEIIDYTAFPMMRKPAKEMRPDKTLTSQDDDVGPTAVLSFDPDNPNSKPDWLESNAADPLNALRDWINMKVNEVYRSANVGGLAATEISTEAKSGAALTAEFQLLNASLVRKAVNLEKTERTLTYFWYVWEYGVTKARQLLEETTIERERSYDVENLSADLENVLTSKTIIKSKRFDAEIQKKTVRRFFPSWTDSQLSEIDDEIEQEAKKPDLPPTPLPFGRAPGTDPNQNNLDSDEVEE
jgi:hypothetical protein